MEQRCLRNSSLVRGDAPFVTPLRGATRDTYYTRVRLRFKLVYTSLIGRAGNLRVTWSSHRCYLPRGTWDIRDRDLSRSSSHLDPLAAGIYFVLPKYIIKYYLLHNCTIGPRLFSLDAPGSQTRRRRSHSLLERPSLGTSALSVSKMPQQEP